MNNKQELMAIFNQIQALMNQAIDIIGPEAPPFQPTLPEEIEANRVAIARAKLGSLVETTYLVVQIVSKGFNKKTNAGIIKYYHPTDSDEPQEVKEYWVSANKADLTLWDELHEGSCYLIETNCYRKEGRSKNFWVWEGFVELPRSVAVVAPSVSNKIPKVVKDWVREHG